MSLWAWWRSERSLSLVSLPAQCRGRQALEPAKPTCTSHLASILSGDVPQGGKGPGTAQREPSTIDEQTIQIWLYTAQRA